MVRVGLTKKIFSLMVRADYDPIERLASRNNEQKQVCFSKTGPSRSGDVNGTSTQHLADCFIAFC